MPASHYDRYPYDVGIVTGEVYVERDPLFGALVEDAGSSVVLDVGCGPGALLSSLGRRSSHTVGVDLSRNSLARAKAAVRGLPVSLVQADALRLPLADGTIDLAVASGSLHHTGNALAAFAELRRVLSQGGRAYVSLYRAGSYYHTMYRTVGRLARSAARSPWCDRVVNGWVLLPVFAAYLWLGRLALHRTLTLPSRAQVRNYFADQLLNPVVSFHTEAQFHAWAAAVQADVLSSRSSHAGALMTFLLSVA